ncbi:unnamed protein product [Closterium sp. NIES-54]
MPLPRPCLPHFSLRGAEAAGSERRVLSVRAGSAAENNAISAINHPLPFPHSPNAPPVSPPILTISAYEVQKLLALKDAFSQYAPAALPSWSVEGRDPCKSQWKEGKIACNNAGRVIRLNLSNQNLKGPLPGQELAKLVALKRLDLGFNNFTGEIPIELADISSITYLSLESNQIEGALPEWIGSEWTSLVHLRLASNQFSGQIPNGFGQLKNLVMLDLASNQFSGSIPTDIQVCSRLEQLSLSGNSLSGSLPTWIGSLKQLRVLEMFSNNLSGTIPAEIAQATSLESIALDDNDLSGTLPDALGNLPSLAALYIASNLLEGPIPYSYHRLNGLMYIDLSYNTGINGTVPEFFGNLWLLESIAFENCNLTGTIPASLGSLSLLVEIFLDNNKLTGSIPETLGGLESLNKLYLNQNFLEGSVPSTLCNLTNVREINLSKNGLDGDLPLCLVTLPHVSSLLVSYNQLSGDVPDIPDDSKLFFRYDHNCYEGMPDQSPCAEPSFTSDGTTTSDGNINDYGADNATWSDTTADDYQQFYDNSSSGNSQQSSQSSSSSECAGGMERGDEFFKGQAEPQAIIKRAHDPQSECNGQLSSVVCGVDMSKYTGSSFGVVFLADEFFKGQAQPRAIIMRSLSPPSRPTTEVSEFLFKVEILAKARHRYVVNLHGYCVNQGERILYPTPLHPSPQLSTLFPPFSTPRHPSQQRSASKCKVEILAKARHRYVPIKPSPPLPTPLYSPPPLTTPPEVSEFLGSASSTPSSPLSTPLHHPLSLSSPSFHPSTEVSEFLFKCKVEILAKARHRYVVNLHGFCVNQGERILVYEFLPNGTLFDRLHRPELEPLAWETRVRVAYHVASALEHLHHDLTPPLVHRAVTSSNILLAADMTAKLSDFGIAKGSSGGKSAFDDTPRRKKSRKHKQVADVQSPSPQMEKADVYGFGVVLLELITGQKAMKESPSPQMEKADVYGCGVVLLELITGQKAMKEVHITTMVRYGGMRLNAVECWKAGGDDEESGLLVEGYSAAAPTFGQGVTHLHPPNVRVDGGGHEHGSAVMREERQVTGISGISAPASAWASIEGEQQQQWEVRGSSSRSGSVGGGDKLSGRQSWRPHSR